MISHTAFVVSNCSREGVNAATTPKKVKNKLDSDVKSRRIVAEKMQQKEKMQ